jgi:hypothetical protein
MVVHGQRAFPMNIVENRKMEVKVADGFILSAEGTRASGSKPQVTGRDAERGAGSSTDVRGWLVEAGLPCAAQKNPAPPWLSLDPVPTDSPSSSLSSSHTIILHNNSPSRPH